MKSLLFFFTSILITLLPARAGEEVLRILCYNIHYGQGNDGVYDLERLAAVIKAVDPDLVALQEVDVMVRRSGQVHQAEELGKLTGLDVYYGPTQHYEGGLFGNAVLTKLPVSRVWIQPLPYTEATPELTTYPRGFVAVTVKTPGGKDVRFVSTHFQHNVEEDRIAEAEAVNRYLAVESEKIPTLLAGDINAVPESEPMKVLLSKWSNVIDAEAAPTVPSKEPKSRIDYIFYRQGDPFEIVETRVIAEEMASDHRPVFAVLRVK
ncbi:MAG: endonuclease/exonuclease/phosphatase family protein [Verrucomicrobiales bacterium]|nr:endonuclease/exonuclease/phosphatase family protein [Verrucomicrobiales bacterium]